MNITSAVLLREGGYLVECEEGLVNVPEASGNRHYIALLEWIEGGGTVEEQQPLPTPVPEMVSRFQALAVLHMAGHLSSIESFMASGDVDPIVRLAWENAQEFRRSSPTLAAVSTALGISDTELDQLFITASQIEA